MPRRIELELTSERPDGTWTWRAAGAREPRGELEGSLLPSGAKVGDVLRADAEFDIEGITVLSVLPPKGSRPEPERIELIGPQREFQPVTSTLVGRRERGERRGDRPRREGDDRPRSPRGDRPDRERRDRPDRDRRDRDRAPRGEHPDRPERPRRQRPAPPPPKPKPKKLRPGRRHRDELLARLSPEQQPIAEQLFRGGIPGVRAALDEQNAAARAEGKPEVPAGTVMQIAETLVSSVRTADWLDRAEAALAGVDEIALRDLRAVVTSAEDLARDDATRELAGRLKEALERRTAAEQEEWRSDLEQSLAAGRVVRALRLSSRPPQPGEALPPETTSRLVEAAGAAMTADIAPDRWATLLDAVAYSPVRREVTPAGVPAEPTEELLGAVRKHAGRTPTIATLFGVEPPPSPSKRGPGRRGGGAAKRGASPAAPGGGLRRPPKAPAGPIPSPVLGRRIPPPPRPPAAPVPSGPARAADEVEAVAPAAEPAPPSGEVPEAEPQPPTQSGALAAEGAARDSAAEPVPDSVQEPVVGDDVPPAPSTAEAADAPAVETTEEPVATEAADVPPGGAGDASAGASSTGERLADGQPTEPAPADTDETAAAVPPATSGGGEEPSAEASSSTDGEPEQP